VCKRNVQRKKVSLRLTLALALLAASFLIPSPRAVAQQEVVLYNFGPAPDGNAPTASLIFDSSGNLYGTGSAGGVLDDGAVFELKREGSGEFKEKLIHSATGNDGFNTYGSLIFDKAGNLYGVENGGGPYNAGTVFELTPTGGNIWKETVLYNFDGVNGNGPGAGLVFDKNGNLYGTTIYGGSTSTACDTHREGCGTVFELVRQPGGMWAEKVLHAFNRDGTDGTQPVASVIFDDAGNIYGMTSQGGSADGGVAFELTPGPGGVWTETLLHTFLNNGADGFNSQGGLIFDASGNLYGTTGGGGGTVNRGTVFELSPAGGSWTETILYAFKDNASDGIIPYGGVIFDAKGNLYGVTGDGGNLGFGTVFELTPAAGGWTETLLYNFGNAPDGNYPNGPLIFDQVGNLYGTTEQGGSNAGCDFGSCGTVFRITP